MKRKILIFITVLFFLFALYFLGYLVKTDGVGSPVACLKNKALPDPKCTVGIILTSDTKVICVSGYTKTVRNVSMATKRAVFSEYGIPYSLRYKYEVDHLIPLELGGSNDIINLWPESYLIKNGSLVKDKFENYLHKQVCNGKMDIKEAQEEISTNWVKYYKVK